MSAGDDLAGRIDALATERGITAGCHLVLAHDDEASTPLLEWRDLGDEHVASYLYRTPLPRSCTAVAVVNGATLHHLPDEASTRDVVLDRSRVLRSERIRAVSAITRQGSFASRVRSADGTEREELRGGPQVGLVPDALRRVFGLATPPPAVSTCQVFATGWMSELVMTARAGARLSWERAVRMHPGVQALERAGEDTVDLAKAGRLLAEAWGWVDLRFLVMAGRWPCQISREEATLHDAGSFSRRLLSTLPTVEALVDEVRRYLPPSVSKRVPMVLRQWELLPPVPALPARGDGDGSGEAA